MWVCKQGFREVREAQKMRLSVQNADGAPLKG